MRQLVADHKTKLTWPGKLCVFKLLFERNLLNIAHILPHQVVINSCYHGAFNYNTKPFIGDHVFGNAVVRQVKLFYTFYTEMLLYIYQHAPYQVTRVIEAVILYRIGHKVVSHNMPEEPALKVFLNVVVPHDLVVIRESDNV